MYSAYLSLQPTVTPLIVQPQGDTDPNTPWSKARRNQVTQLLIRFGWLILVALAVAAAGAGVAAGVVADGVVDDVLPHRQFRFAAVAIERIAVVAEYDWWTFNGVTAATRRAVPAPLAAYFDPVRIGGTLSIDQIVWWDEKHVDCAVEGAASGRGKTQVRFRRDPDGALNLSHGRWAGRGARRG